MRPCVRHCRLIGSGRRPGSDIADWSIRFLMIDAQLWFSSNLSCCQLQLPWNCPFKRPLRSVFIILSEFLDVEPLFQQKLIFKNGLWLVKLCGLLKPLVKRSGGLTYVRPGFGLTERISNTVAYPLFLRGSASAPPPPRGEGGRHGWGRPQPHSFSGARRKNHLIPLYL